MLAVKYQQKVQIASSDASHNQHVAGWTYWKSRQITWCTHSLPNQPSSLSILLKSTTQPTICLTTAFQPHDHFPKPQLPPWPPHYADSCTKLAPVPKTCPYQKYLPAKPPSIAATLATWQWQGPRIAYAHPKLALPGLLDCQAPLRLSMITL